uniref:RNA-directed DNA polymerase n=1 Tax=Tanacetum cinerariifolium TaxID=118510 RepID=A0A6L2M0A6_TANCI|nr:reverse transcriptase domain-containing protein [Tanacetum cinerariifolium]
MQTRSSLRLVSNPSSNPTPSTNLNPKGRNRRHSKQRIEELNLDELSPPIVTMADQRIMAQLLQAPTEGYEDAIVVPAITADNFELKHSLLTLVQNKQFFGHDKEDPHVHVRYFNKITSTLKFLNVLNTSIKLMLFPFSLEGATWIWLEKEPPRSIFTWDDLVSKFINQFFPTSETTNLRKEITNFQQCFDEYFNEEWDRFKNLLRACPYHGFLKLHQLDTFYNALNSKDQDSLNSTTGGNFLDKMPRECLDIIESKSKVRYSRNKQVVAKVSTNTSTFGISPDVAELKDMVKALLLDKKSQNQSLAPLKAVEESCVTCGGAHSYRNCLATDGNVYRDNIQEFVSQASAVNYNQGNTSYRPPMIGVSYDGPQILSSTYFLPKVVENKPEATKDTMNPTNNESTEDVQPPVVKSESPILNSEPVTSQISEHVIALILKDMSFEISFADALILMPKFASTLKALIRNKEKLSEMARTPLNKHCSAVLLKKLPKILGDPGKFLIACDFPGMAEFLALADLGASINLMPFFVWKRLSLPDLTPTCMTLELADHSISRPVRVAEDVYVKVGSFHFLADFVVIDFDADPRVPLILGRSFLKTGRALIDVFEANYSDMTANCIDVIDMDCEVYSQEVLGFSDVISSGNPTSYYDPIISTTSPTLAPFGNSDFLLEEVDAFLAIEGDPTSHELYQPYLDLEGDILLLEAFLNDDLSLPPPTQGNYLPKVRKELKICEAKSDKSSIYESQEVELKDLPPHLEYAFLEGDDKLPVTIAKDLSVEKKTALITVLNLWVSPVHCVPKKGGFTIVENEDNELVLTRLVTGWRVCIDYRKLNEATRKDHFSLSFMDQMLERLAGNQYYCFLDDFYCYFQIPIDLKDQVKTTFTCPYRTFAYRRMPFGLCNAPDTFQRCMMAIFHDMIKKTMEVVMDDFSAFGNSFQSCLTHLERMLKSDFAIGAVLGHHQDKHFRPIHYASKTMTEAESNYTTTKKEMLAVVYAFKKFRSYLIMNKSIVYMDHSALKYLFAKKDSKERLLRWVLLLQEFTFKVIDTKGAENLVADHLSLLENLHQNVLDLKEINELFSLEILNLVSTHGNQSTLWFADFANYHAGNFVVKGMSSQQKSQEAIEILKAFHYEPTRGHHGPNYTAKKNPRAIIIDRGTYFWNDQFAKVMQKFGVTHRLATPYHPQTSGQVEVSNCSLKHILERAVACHLPIELEHKAYWALKHANFNLKTASDHRKFQINEINELRDQAYENSLIYKEKTKRLHDLKIKDRVFNIGDKVLLFNSRLMIFSSKLKSRWSGPFTIS